MAKTQKEEPKINVSDTLRDVYYADDNGKTAYEHYFVEHDEDVDTTVKQLKQSFLKEINRVDSNNSSIYPSMILLRGVNLNYIWAMIEEKIFPMKPENCAINFESFLTDMEETFAQNKKELILANKNKNSKYPTQFTIDLAELICEDLIGDKALGYWIVKEDGTNC